MHNFILVDRCLANLALKARATVTWKDKYSQPCMSVSFSSYWAFTP